MRAGKVSWVVLALALMLALTWVLPAVPRPKARAMRVQAVNSVAPVFIPWAGTNTGMTPHR